MYIPSYFNEPSIEKAHELIRNHSFATLITAFPELHVTHIPLLLRKNIDGRTFLVGHMARGNPHWKILQDGKSTAIFHGPHTYITPSWYEDAENVPTWNYAAVHVSGKISLITDAETLRQDLEELVQVSEKNYNGTWSMSGLPTEFFDGLSKGIVGFHLEIEEIQTKFKMSQNRTEQDRLGVIKGLAGRTDEDSRQVMELVKAALV